MRVNDRNPEDVVIDIPSGTNRDLGLFIISIAIIAIYPVYYLANQAMGEERVPPEYGIYLTAAFILWGVWLIYSCRRSFRIQNRNRTMQITDGWLNKGFTLHWDSLPAVKLTTFKDQMAARPIEYWLVNLVDGKKEFALARTVRNFIEIRALAEAISRTLQCPLVDATYTEGPIQVDAQDINLPFRQRAQRYPAMLGPDIPRPASTGVKMTDAAGQRRFQWGVGSTGFMLEIIGVAALAIILSFLPIIPGLPSLARKSMQVGNFFFYQAMLVLIVLMVTAVAGFKATLVLESKGLTFSEDLWGLILLRKRILWDELEEIRMHQGIRGPEVHFIADETGIFFRMADADSARWITSEVRHYLLDEGAATIPADLAAPANPPRNA